MITVDANELYFLHHRLRMITQNTRRHIGNIIMYLSYFSEHDFSFYESTKKLSTVIGG